jgi:hypothetical protein
VHGTDTKGKAAAGASRVRHGHWRVGDLGPDGLSRGGLATGLAGRNGWAGADRAAAC